MKKYKLIVNNNQIIKFDYFTQRIKNICLNEKWDIFILKNGSYTRAATGELSKLFD